MEPQIYQIPPPELVMQWYLGAKAYPPDQWVTDVAAQAARWGADQELEACCEWLGMQETRSPKWFDLRHDACALVSDLRAARRPKPPSLKEQALTALHAVATGANDTREQYQDLDTIRRALEQL
jgi:hypothetical protein